jgi:CHASE3 domain sensor protein
MSPQRKELRKRILILFITVAVLHGTVIGVYYWQHIASRAVKTQETFIAVWVVLTLGVVTAQMKTIRKLRRPR